MAAAFLSGALPWRCHRELKKSKQLMWNLWDISGWVLNQERELGRQHHRQKWLGTRMKDIYLCFLPSLTRPMCITVPSPPAPLPFPGRKTQLNPGLTADNREISEHCWNPMRIPVITSKITLGTDRFSPPCVSFFLPLLSHLKYQVVTTKGDKDGF